MDYLTCVFNKKELFALFRLFSEKKLIRPKEGEILSLELPDGCHSLFFKKEYLSDINNVFSLSFFAGRIPLTDINLRVEHLLKFANPAEKESWINAHDYYLACCRFWG